MAALPVGAGKAEGATSPPVRLVGVIEAPEEETARAVGPRAGVAGAVRTETLRAYDAEEMGRIVQKLG